MYLRLLTLKSLHFDHTRYSLLFVHHRRGPGSLSGHTHWGSYSNKRHWNLALHRVLILVYVG